MISEVIQSGCFTSGPYIAEVESKLKEFYESSTCIATASGTDAIKIALKAVGVGDEVILPLNSFSATENAIMAIGAAPVFANIDKSFNMIPSEVYRLKNELTKAVLPVCLYGSTRNIQDVYLAAKEENLAVVIDAAQCFGIKSIANYCDALALSFNPFKNIGTFGKSGAVISKLDKIGKIARQYSYHGFAEGKKNIKAQDWGYNSRMDNIQAATLAVKLNHFESNATKRSILAARYRIILSDLSKHIELPLENIENSWHLYPLIVIDKNRDDLITFARQKGVEFDIYYPILSHLSENNLASAYPLKRQFEKSEKIHQSLVHIPLHNHISIEEQNFISEVIHDFFK